MKNIGVVLTAVTAGTVSFVVAHALGVGAILANPLIPTLLIIAVISSVFGGLLFWSGRAVSQAAWLLSTLITMLWFATGNVFGIQWLFLLSTLIALIAWTYALVLSTRVERSGKGDMSIG